MSFKYDISSINIENHTLENKTVNRFLGIFLDNRLKLEAHVDYIIPRISSACYAVKVIRGELDKETARGAYYALIESQF